MEQPTESDPSSQNSNGPKVLSESPVPNPKHIAIRYYERAKNLISRVCRSTIVRVANVLNPFSALLTAVGTIAIAVLTYFVAVYARDQGNISRLQSDIEKRQLAFTESEERPWVFVSDAQIGSDFEFDGAGGASIHIKYTLQNVGHSPAEFTFVDNEIHDQPVYGPFSPIEIERKECDPIRNRLYSGATVTIFPGQTITRTEAARLDPSEIKAAEHPLNPYKLRFVDRTLTPIIIGCLDYRFEWSPTKHHQTPFIYQLATFALDKDGKQFPLVMSFPFGWISVSREQLMLDKTLSFDARGPSAD